MRKISHLKQIEDLVCAYYKIQASDYPNIIRRHQYSYDRIIKLLKHLLPDPGRILEIGCGIGQNLAGLNPEYGLGLDLCQEMIDKARELYPASEFPNLKFKCLSALECGSIGATFDTILLVNSITEIPDIVAVFKEIRKLCTPRTRVVMLTYNYRWEPILKLGAKLHLCQKHPAQNWLSLSDCENIFKLSEFEPVKKGFELLLPIGIPIISNLVNRFGSIIPFLRTFSMMYYCTLRPLISPGNVEDFSVTVVVPCKNEEENIDGLVKHIPDMGKGTEIIFVDDKSTDKTADKIREKMEAHPEKKIRLIEGPGKGKGAACRAGFSHAQNDVLMIFDADMTTMPETLPEFLEAISTGKGEFINGSRLVYPRQGQSMKILNVIGNKILAILFSFLLSQRIKDTLCGTKVIWRHDYDKILEARKHFGGTDLWGDYDWLFGANRHNLKIIELPVHYVERTAGETKMTKRFGNFWIMLKMCNLAFWRMKIL